MAENSYFQFPLCSLAFGQTEYERLNTILDYSVIEAGSKLFDKLTADQRQEFLRGRTVSRTNPNGLNPLDWRQSAACYGAHVIGVTYHGFNAMIQRYEQLRNHITDFTSRHGSDAIVRIKKNWLFKARDGRGLTYREFFVLCGLFSAVGDKGLAIVTRERIRHCALGYRTAAIMDAELSRRPDKAQPLTMRQVGYTIFRLHRNRFFARRTVFRRITYYSNRLDNEAMGKKIVERRTYPGFFRASQSAQDQALTDAIKQKRREAAQAAPKAPPGTRPFRFPPLGESG